MGEGEGRGGGGGDGLIRGGGGGGVGNCQYSGVSYVLENRGVSDV